MTAARKRRIAVGRGAEAAELVLGNARVLDVFSGTWVEGDVAIVDGVIAGIGRDYRGAERVDCGGRHLVPGFIDAHLHVESTLMVPSECGKAALTLGTTSLLWDPHEIGNVFGIDGLRWAVDCTAHTPADFFVMASSCVPSSPLESSGASINVADLQSLRAHKRVVGLAEMMNFPGVLFGDSEVMDKLEAFADLPLDGHAPGLTGCALDGYISAGIRTDHECTVLEEAREKLARGMRVIIREGSVAKNAATLIPILNDYSSAYCAFCTDDRNPWDMKHGGHIDGIIRIALEHGVRPEVAYRVASTSAAQLYRLHDRGAVAPGYNADIVVLEDLQSVGIHSVYKDGRLVGANDFDWGSSPKAPRENAMNVGVLDASRLRLSAGGSTARVHVIDVVPGQIVTGRSQALLPVRDGGIQGSDDVLKMAVIERHAGTGNTGIGFVRGFGLREGAIASSVAHDAHNLGVIGVSDSAMLAAARKVEEMGGGIAVVNSDGQCLSSLPLPVAGLMSVEPFDAQVDALGALHEAAKSLGGVLEEPFLQLSFLALPVIPSLKLTDRGLVDVDAFEIVDVRAA